MKAIILFVVVSLFTNLLYGQEANFSIKGSIKNPRKGAIVNLRYNTDKGIALDTSLIVDGTFQFSGFIDEPRPGVLSVQLPNSPPPGPDALLSIYVEPGETLITGRGALSYALVKGGPTTTENNELNKLLGTDKPAKDLPVQTSSRVVALPAGQRPPSASVGNVDAALQAIKDAQNSDRTRKTIKFIKANPTSFVSLYSLQSLWTNKKIDKKEFDSLLDGLSPALLDSNMGKVFFKK